MRWWTGGSAEVQRGKTLPVSSQYAHFTVAYWCVLIAALLPLGCAWLARHPELQEHATGAKANSIEALPFFIGAVIIAHQLSAPQIALDILAVVFVTLRIIYIAMYVAGFPWIRSGIWALAFLVNVAILFIGYR